MAQNEKKNPFFEQADFRRLEIEIDVKNVTSQMKIPEKKPGSEIETSVFEINENYLKLVLPSKSCAQGHTLAIDLDILRPTPGAPQDPEKTSIHILGVVEEIVESQEGAQIVRLRLRQYAKVDWEQLLQFLAGTQLEINRFIKQARK